MLTNYKLNFKSSVIVLSFLIVFVIGYLFKGDNLMPEIQAALPQAHYYEKLSTSPIVYEGYADENHLQKVGYAALGEANGYNGPLIIVTGINLEGKIVGTVILDHKDTPSYIQMLIDKSYLKQFLGKAANDPLDITQDIDLVSGATYSSRGIAMAIAQGAHFVAQEKLGLPITTESTPIIFSAKEISILVLIIMALVSAQFKFHKLRWITVIGSMVLIGFTYNSAISMANIASLLLGYFPPWRQFIFWYILLLAIPILIFLLGKNIYCFWLCPFGAVQEIAAKCGGGKIYCTKQLDNKLRKIKYGLAYLSLVFAFLFQNPVLAGYEPFAFLFGLKGYGTMWFILPIVLFTSLFVERFWCRYFCPVGVVFELILKARRLLDIQIKRLYSQGNKENQVIWKGIK